MSPPRINDDGSMDDEDSDDLSQTKTQSESQTQQHGGAIVPDGFRAFQHVLKVLNEADGDVEMDDQTQPTSQANFESLSVEINDTQPVDGVTQAISNTTQTIANTQAIDNPTQAIVGITQVTEEATQPIDVATQQISALTQQTPGITQTIIGETQAIRVLPRWLINSVKLKKKKSKKKKLILLSLLSVRVLLSGSFQMTRNRTQNHQPQEALLTFFQLQLAKPSEK